MRPGAAGSKIAMCCRPSSPISAPRWPSTAAIRRGKTNWRAFSPPRRSLKRCGISATRCAAWKTRLNILTTRSSGDSACSRCTGIRRRATLRACWSTCRWTRRASRRWRGWTNINHKESDGWQYAIFGYCPVGAAGRFPLPPGVGGRQSPAGKSLCYLWLQRTLRSRLVFCVMSLTAQGAHRGRPVAAAPVPRAPASNIATAWCLRLIPAGFGSGRGSVPAKHGPQPASMRAAPAFRERLSDVEAATAAVSVALVGKLTAG